MFEATAKAEREPMNSRRVVMCVVLHSYKDRSTLVTRAQKK
jgi:hypothetical protein